MKKNSKILLWCAIILLFSCNNKRQVNRDDLIGTFEHISKYGNWNGIKNTIEFRNDSSFVHWISKEDSILLIESGKWQYYSEDSKRKPTNLTIYGFTVYIAHYSEDMVYAKKYRGMKAKKSFWNKIYLQTAIPHDPDGSPIIPKYRKIK